MRLVKTPSALLAAALLLLSACKKNDNPAPEIPEESGPAKEGLFTKAKYYFKLSDSTTLAPWYSDSIYYNAKYQISKVAGTNNAGELTTYSFSYNDDGTISRLKVRTAVGDKFDYTFDYKDKRVESFVIYDSSAMSQFPWKMTSKVTYNSQSILSSIVTSEVRGTETKDVYATSYYRNTSGKIDSIRVNFTYTDGVSGFKSIHLSGNASPVNALAASTNTSYQLLLAVRQDQYLLSLGSTNLYFHLFLGAGDNLFNDGIYKKPNTPEGLPYKNESSVNANGSIKTYQYTEVLHNDSQTGFGVKFEYFAGK